ncbi:RICIN domain-containing protein [Streptomyces sp. LN549]|uniref:RICIN domain-containing protein n=1 Tax=Streptomyces sp. LN549 TaxID=3112979 RepID=UPI0037199BF6
MRIRPILALAASAAAVMALATPSQAADDGSYFIQDARTGACLLSNEGLVGGQLGACGNDAVWQVRNLPNGSVQLASGRDESRCLGLSPLKIFPPPVFVSSCGSSPDQWTIAGPDEDGAPVALRLTEVPFTGTLTPREGDRATLAGQGAPEWTFTRVG